MAPNESNELTIDDVLRSLLKASSLHNYLLGHRLAGLALRIDKQNGRCQKKAAKSTSLALAGAAARRVGRANILKEFSIDIFLVTVTRSFRCFPLFMCKFC